MDRTERFYSIDRLLRTHRVVSKRKFIEELRVSDATFKRDLEYLRERFYAPIAYDHGAQGYRLTLAEPNAPRYELPGLWFNAAEAHALLTFRHLLDSLHPGLLSPHIETFRKTNCRPIGKKGRHDGEHYILEVPYTNDAN